MMILTKDEIQRRRSIIESTNRAYAILKADNLAWKEELEERALWDNTLMDGLNGS